MEDTMRNAPWLFAAVGLVTLTAGCVDDRQPTTAHSRLYTPGYSTAYSPDYTVTYSAEATRIRVLPEPRVGT